MSEVFIFPYRQTRNEMFATGRNFDLIRERLKRLKEALK